MNGYDKPLPAITPANKPFWDGAREGKILLQRCCGCGFTWHPVKPLCPECWSDDYEWVPASGRGKINAWMIYYQSFHPGFDAEIPYHVAEVELEEGPRLQTNIVGIRNEDLQAGMPVEAYFDPVTPEVTLIKFQPVAGTGGG